MESVTIPVGINLIVMWCSPVIEERVMAEVWLPVVGFEGCYEVSSQGKIRSLDRVILFKYKGRPVTRQLKGRLLTNGISGCVYPQVGLKWATKNKAVTKRVHKIVTEAFIGVCPKGQEVMHLDGDPLNCRASNLRYGSRSCNMAFTVDHGTALSPEDCARKGEVNGGSVLTKAKVLRIVEFISVGICQRRLAGVFKVSNSAINKISTKRTWRHLTG